MMYRQQSLISPTIGYPFPLVHLPLPTTLQTTKHAPGSVPGGDPSDGDDETGPISDDRMRGAGGTEREKTQYNRLEFADQELQHSRCCSREVPIESMAQTRLETQNDLFMSTYGFVDHFLPFVDGLVLSWEVAGTETCSSLPTKATTIAIKQLDTTKNFDPR
jgi:hypothetical protein